MAAGDRSSSRPAAAPVRAPLVSESEFDETQAFTRLENPAALSVEEPGELKREPDYWYSFISSRILEAGYDPDSERLFVRFVKPRPMGDVYVYDGVTSNIWRNFRRSASPGRYVNRVLNNFDYHKVNL